MKTETVFWLLVTVAALVSMGVLIGDSDGNGDEGEDELFSTADERHAIADVCIGGHGDENDPLVRHDHATISVSVNGELVTIPNGVGLDDNGCSMRALHTHDSQGKIHIEFKEEGVEAPIEAFFDIWGKHMDSTGFDEHRIDANHEFLMFVTQNGERVEVDSFENHILENGQTIELVFREKA